MGTVKSNIKSQNYRFGLSLEHYYVKKKGAVGLIYLQKGWDLQNTEENHCALTNAGSD